MRQFKNNLKRSRSRNHSDRSFKRSSEVDRLNGNFALVLANFIAFLDGSIASNLQNGLSFKIDIDKHPAPTPTSRILLP